MIKKSLNILLIVIFLVLLWNCKKEQKEQICNKVVHGITPPLFTAEQEQIIDKYRNVIHSKLLQPERYFILYMEERLDKTYNFILFPIKSLQDYASISLQKNRKNNYFCGGTMGLDNDVWFIINEQGEIIESNEHGHPFRELIFR